MYRKYMSNNEEFELSNSENNNNLRKFFTNNNFKVNNSKSGNFKVTNEEVKEKISKPFATPSTRKRNFKAPNTMRNLNTYVKTTRKNNGNRWRNVHNITEAHSNNIKVLESLSVTKGFAKLLLDAKLNEYNLSLAKQRKSTDLAALKFKVLERFRNSHLEGIKVFNILGKKRLILLKANKKPELKSVNSILEAIKKNLTYIVAHMKYIEAKY
jgi:hypothetical protein